MGNNVIKRLWNKNALTNIEDLRGMTFQAEEAGHTFEIRGVDGDGNTIALSGTPAGVMLRPDNTDVALTCAVSEGVVTATLPAECYDVPGRFGLTVYLTSDGQKTAIYAAIGSVARTSSGNVSPATTASVVDLINAIEEAIEQIPASDTNLKAALAPTYSTSAVYPVGSYAWYNGTLYKCIVAITSGEAWTSAHWTEAKLGQDVCDLKNLVSADDNLLLNEIMNRMHADGFIRNSLADEFVPGVIYSVGSYAWHEGKLYKCIAAVVGETEWNPDNWTEIKLSSDIIGLKTALVAEQTARKNEDAELKGEITNVRTDIGAPFVDFTPIDGKYIFGNTEKSAKDFSRSNPIAVSKGDIVEFTATGYSNSVAMIAICNAEGTTFTDAVRCTDGNNEHTYTYTATADGYIVVSYDHRQPHTLIIKGESSNITLNSRVTALEAVNPSATAEVVGLNILVNHAEMSITVGNFVNDSGVVRPNNNFGMSNPVSLNEGDTIAFNAMGYLQAVAILAKVSNGVYTPLIISADSYEHDFSYTADTTMSVVVSTSKNVVPDYTVYNSHISNIEAELKNIKNDFFAFATMGVIGDSLASGASNYTGGAADRPLYSWGKYIERNHGVQTSLFSFGGATTRTWLSNNRGRTALLNGDILDCYVIGLGVNDAYSLGASYLGSISDVNVGNEDANADTYYGNYSRVIAAIKQKSPRAKIFCLTNPKTNGINVPEFNSAIADIVELYTNVYLIDLTADTFYQSVLFNETWNTAHSTAVGYKLIAENLYCHIEEIIKNNISEFTDIQWIIENHN